MRPLLASTLLDFLEESTFTPPDIESKNTTAPEREPESEVKASVAPDGAADTPDGEFFSMKEYAADAVDSAVRAIADAFDGNEVKASVAPDGAADTPDGEFFSMKEYAADAVDSAERAIAILMAKRSSDCIIIIMC